MGSRTENENYMELETATYILDVCVCVCEAVCVTLITIGIVYTFSASPRQLWLYSKPPPADTPYKAAVFLRQQRLDCEAHYL